MHYTICDLLADLTQNAVEADASKVTVEFLETDTELKVYIRDNGKGMDAETLKRVSIRFYRRHQTSQSKSWLRHSFFNSDYNRNRRRMEYRFRS